jgi:hypothetical protein
LSWRPRPSIANGFVPTRARAKSSTSSISALILFVAALIYQEVRQSGGGGGGGAVQRIAQIMSKDAYEVLTQVGRYALSQ